MCKKYFVLYCETLTQINVSKINNIYNNKIKKGLMTPNWLKKYIKKKMRLPVSIELKMSAGK